MVQDPSRTPADRTARAPSQAAAQTPTSRDAFAWAFLRRSPAYLAAYARTGAWTDVSAFGLAASVDPHSAAPCAPWAPEAAPAVVLELIPQGGGAVLPPCARAWPRLRLARGLWVFAPLGLQLLITDGGLGAPVRFATPPDDRLAVRLRALQALERALRGVTHEVDLTPQQRHRLIRALAVLDARAEGLSYRETAVRLFGREAVAGEPWKTSSRRDVTLRLARLGADLCGGGYRRLLETRRS